MKKKISLLLTGVILAASAANVFGSEGMFIDNKPYVPVRNTFEELGFGVDYDNGMATAVVTDDNYTIKIPKNKNYFVVNDKGLKPDNPQRIVNERMYIPYSAVGISIAAETSYDSDNETAHVNYNNKDSYINYENSQVSTMPQNNSAEITEAASAENNPNETTLQKADDTFTTLTDAEKKFIKSLNFKELLETIVKDLEDAKNSYPGDPGDFDIVKDESYRNKMNSWIRSINYKADMKEKVIEIISINITTLVDGVVILDGKLSVEFNRFISCIYELKTRIRHYASKGSFPIKREKFFEQANNDIQYCNELLKKYQDY